MRTPSRRSSQAREDAHRPCKAGRLLCKLRKLGQKFWGAPSEPRVGEGETEHLGGKAEKGKAASGSLD